MYMLGTPRFLKPPWMSEIEVKRAVRREIVPSRYKYEGEMHTLVKLRK